MSRTRQESAQKGAQKADKGSHLYQGVAFLFGRQLVAEAQKYPIERMAIEADLVAEGARQLRVETGNPERQMAIIRAMDVETAIALCRWMLEPACMAKYLEKHRH